MNAGPSILNTRDRRDAALYWSLAATLVLACALHAAFRPRLSEAGTDLWQHLATLGAIIDAPLSPANPFVATDEPSRLFGPYWMAVGGLAALLGLSPLQAFGLGGLLNLLLLAAGVWRFGRAYFGRPAGALALLVTILLGAALPVSFTGYLTPLALLSGAAYPAYTALALGLLLLAAAIRAVEHEGYRGWSTPLLTALSVATHPMGSAVGLAGVAAFALLHPGANARTTLRLAGLVAIGVALALLWPFYPVGAVLLGAGDGAWFGSADHYRPAWLLHALAPAAVGLAGLLADPCRHRALLALLAACVAGFLLGATPAFAAGHRLLPYIALVLEIGLAALLLRAARASGPARLATAIALAASLALQTAWIGGVLRHRAVLAERDGDLRAHARRLVADLPPDALIAGDWSTFPLVAEGRRVLATPLPEPGIATLAARQAATAALADPALPLARRRATARAWGVTHLILDTRTTNPATLAALAREAAGARRQGPLVFLRLRP